MPNGENEPDIPICDNCLEELDKNHKYEGNAEDGFVVVCPHPKRVECDICNEIVEASTAVEIETAGLYWTVGKAYICKNCSPSGGDAPAKERV